MASAHIQLSDHFSFSKLGRFTWPSVIMMVVSALYGVVDGVMVSNFVGKTAFAALNLIYPFVALLSAFGFMFGTGGSALVAKVLGEGKKDKANEIFSFLTFALITLSVLLGGLGLIFLEDIAKLLGAEGQMIPLCKEYAQILLVTLTPYVLQVYFQSFLVTAECPKFGMWLVVAAGITNVVLDVLFIAVLDWGLAGAAWATAASYMVGGFIPLGYFIFKPKNDARPLFLVSVRHFGRRLGFYARALLHVTSNGLSEFVMNISMQIVSMLYMYQLMATIGENGVAAYGIIMYMTWIFISVLLGYSVGVAPVVSFHYGAGDKAELSSLLRKSLTVMAAFGILMPLTANIFAPVLAGIFVSYDHELWQLTVHGFRIYSLHFFFTGLNIYASSFFTSLNNGPVSALIALCRTLLFECGCVILIPMIFGLEGIWWSVVVAEFIASLLSASLLFAFRNRYGYNTLPQK